MKYSVEQLELSWAAGFFDGEGNTRLNKKTLVLQISQIERAVLDRFCSAVGLGKVYGAYYYSYCAHPLYCYMVNNIDAKKVFYKIRPYLGLTKERQALEAIKNWKEAHAGIVV